MCKSQKGIFLFQISPLLDKSVIDLPNATYCIGNSKWSMKVLFFIDSVVFPSYALDRSACFFEAYCLHSSDKLSLLIAWLYPSNNSVNTIKSYTIVY